MNCDAIIVGLGNPGPRYAFTRHNIGFISLEVLAQGLGQKFSMSKPFNAEICETNWEGKKILLVKPQTFMNLSGESLRAIYQKHPHLREKPLIVIHDEVDVPFGQMRVKMGGGDAGHNGLKSLREHLGHGDFLRVRFGVGKPPQGSPVDLKDYVLQEFTKADEEKLLKLVDRSLDICETLLKKDLAAAQVIAAKEV